MPKLCHLIIASGVPIHYSADFRQIWAFRMNLPAEKRGQCLIMKRFAVSFRIMEGYLGIHKID